MRSWEDHLAAAFDATTDKYGRSWRISTAELEADIAWLREQGVVMECGAGRATAHNPASGARAAEEYNPRLGAWAATQARAIVAARVGVPLPSECEADSVLDRLRPAGT